MFKFNSQGIPDNVLALYATSNITREISDVWRTSSATAYVETISSITDLVLTEIHSWNTDLFYTGGISLRGVIRSITKVMYYKYRPVAPHFL